MREQAGNRIICSFYCVDDDGSETARTSHFKDEQEILIEWDKLIGRYGNDNVTVSTACDIAGYIKAYNA